MELMDIPFLPVRLFKEFDLLSVPLSSVFKTMTSSGTSGQRPSKVYLDRDTALLQTKILARQMVKILGKKRRPMLIIDSPGVLKDRNAFSARGAGILGFSMYGRDVTYAIDESMKLNIDALMSFVDRHKDEPVFIFGFTFMVWKYFIETLKREGLKLPFAAGTLLHGGGWKKLQDQSVDNEVFRAEIETVTGITQVVNYYGLVEQTGSLFMECENHHLHAPVYSDVIIRDPRNFGVAKKGEEGIIQVLSLIPRSYPGHSLLTEDLGVLLGEDDCSCGRLGKYFHVLGRLKSAEIRGCSDTHESIN
jgi:phenylacetate-coenzyme A ligase PaaK-like adenylate-forming protein